MPNPGDKLGPYALIRPIGQGGFGEVWLAERPSDLLSVPVALKLSAIDPAGLAAVEREAKLWKMASGHPNVVPVQSADVFDEHVAVASEFIRGGSLYDWLQEHDSKAPSLDEALAMTQGILAGLAHLHSVGIVHRDLKPENILLQAGVPRLTDFGLARAVSTRN